MADLGFFSDDPPAPMAPQSISTAAPFVATAVTTPQRSIADALVAARSANAVAHPGDRFADPDDDPPEDPVSPTGEAAVPLPRPSDDAVSLFFTPPPIPSPPLPDTSSHGSGSSNNSGEMGPDVVLIPEHYVPLDQIEYLRPAEKLRHFAASAVTAHRVYIARSMPTILPRIARQATLNDSLARVFALVTDVDSGVRTAAAAAVADLLGTYVANAACPSLARSGFRSSESLVAASASAAAAVAASATSEDGDAQQQRGTLTASNVVSLVQMATPADWPPMPRSPLSQKQQQPTVNSRGEIVPDLLLSPPPSAALRVTMPTPSPAISALAGLTLFSPPPSAGPPSPGNAHPPNAASDSDTKAMMLMYPSTLADPAAAAFLPMHLLTVTVLPLLVDPLRRIAESTHDHLVRAVADPPSSRVMPSTGVDQRIAHDAWRLLARAIVDWAVRVLSLTRESAIELVEGAVAAVSAAAEHEAREKAVAALEAAAARDAEHDAAAAASSAASQSLTSPLASPTATSSFSNVGGSDATNSDTPLLVGMGSSGSRPKHTRFIDHTRAFQEKVQSPIDPFATPGSAAAFVSAAAALAMTPSSLVGSQFAAASSGTTADPSTAMSSITNATASISSSSTTAATFQSSPPRSPAPPLDAATLFAHAGSMASLNSQSSANASGLGGSSDDDLAGAPAASDSTTAAPSAVASVDAVYGTAADPHLRSLLFILTQTSAAGAASHVSGMDGPGGWSGSAGSITIAVHDSLGAPIGSGTASPAATTDAGPVAKRLEEVHAGLLEFVADPAVAAVLSPAQRRRLLLLIRTHFVGHEAPAVRGAAAAAIATCLPVIGADAVQVLDDEVIPALKQLASDKVYVVRRRAAEAAPGVMENVPSAVQGGGAHQVVTMLLGDQSKNVRDAMYAGLARCVLAMATGGTDTPTTHNMGESTDADAMDVSSGNLVAAAAAAEFTDPVDGPSRAPLTMDLRPLVLAEADPTAMHPHLLLAQYSDTNHSHHHHHHVATGAALTTTTVADLPHRAPFASRVPEPYLDTYCLVGMKWKDPDRMARCAFAMPAMASVLPSAWWAARFRSLYVHLARDPLSDVRRPLISAIDVMARVIPREAVVEDLVPVVLDWLAREDPTVQTMLYSKLPGILHQVDAISEIPSALLCAPLLALVDSQNWHFRHMCARTIPSWLELYTQPGVGAHVVAQLTDIQAQWTAAKARLEEESASAAAAAVAAGNTYSYSGGQNSNSKPFDPFMAEIGNSWSTGAGGDGQRSRQATSDSMGSSNGGGQGSEPEHSLSDVQQGLLREMVTFIVTTQIGSESSGSSTNADGGDVMVNEVTMRDSTDSPSSASAPTLAVMSADDAWAAFLRPIFTLLLSDPIMAVRTAAIASFPAVASQLSPGMQADLVSRVLLPGAEADQYTARAMAASVVAHWVPTILAADPESRDGTAERVGHDLGTLAVALARDRVLNVRLPISTVFADDAVARTLNAAATNAKTMSSPLPPSPLSAADMHSQAPPVPSSTSSSTLLQPPRFLAGGSGESSSDENDDDPMDVDGPEQQVLQQQQVTAAAGWSAAAALALSPRNALVSGLAAARDQLATDTSATIRERIARSMAAGGGE
ncbi:hypothetical protein BC828DRAFT_389101 [Blastocladiella britannica]|nr:hypothetical protein BC828DRAFT_389101 [Blastocladiella britannica]